METTYNVRVWTIQRRKNAQGKVTSYRVRWKLADLPPFHETFRGKTQASSFHAELVSAQRKGIAFDKASGLPVTMTRQKDAVNWLVLAKQYMDARWRDWSPNHRKHTARALMEVTIALLPSDNRPDTKVLRRALTRHLNRNTRSLDHGDAAWSALRWTERNCPDVSALEDPAVLRPLLQALDVNLNGERAAANTVRLRRRALDGAIRFAIEQGSLDTNPLQGIQMKKRAQSLRQVDPRAVVNPMQARMLLAAVSELGKQGPPLVAFFGCMYYAAMRPEEVCGLKKGNLSLPSSGWGEIYVEKARPEISNTWTDSGEASEERGLKHRDDDTGRTVPCPPQLTELLHQHLSKYGTARDDRLFRGARDGGRVGSTTYGRVWARARQAVFTTEVVAGPLAKRPYDLRHAAVSTWLNGGVEPTRVAKWAGHSVKVLLETYAKCLDGGERLARDRVENALRGW
ncbi:tyrosine-type recombinase/integrase [Haloechinothrix salitolerans]|uniref:Tyrosine-type recombinase/integrase n=1 Tax=Haloechinothrix salitolerans TaxID=926830 RepID=A0ABW2CA76_9PSEU